MNARLKLQEEELARLLDAERAPARKRARNSLQASCALVEFAVLAAVMAYFVLGLVGIFS